MIYQTILSYLKKKADPYYDLRLERERWKPPAPAKFKPWKPTVKPWGPPSSLPKEVDKIVQNLQATHDIDTLDSLHYYGRFGYRNINQHLRAKAGLEVDESVGTRHLWRNSDRDYEVPYGADDYDEGDTEDPQYHIKNIDKGMARSPLTEPLVCWRGLLLDTNHPLVSRLQQIGGFEKGRSPSSFSYSKAVGLKGFTFTEPSYLSTSLNETVAKKFTNSEHRFLLLELHVPIGTQAIYLPGTHAVSPSNVDLVPFMGMSSEAEVLLDRGLVFKVTNISLIKGRGFVIQLHVVS